MVVKRSYFFETEEVYKIYGGQKACQLTVKMSKIRSDKCGGGASLLLVVACVHRAAQLGRKLHDFAILYCQTIPPSNIGSGLNLARDFFLCMWNLTQAHFFV